uniref:Uncharacterized protein n=1 Tax=Arion vulgaris TaxID=1028688 RepID=A0A0B7BMV1_9EUPU
MDECMYTGGSETQNPGVDTTTNNDKFAAAETKAMMEMMMGHNSFNNEQAEQSSPLSLRRRASQSSACVCVCVYKIDLIH